MPRPTTTSIAPPPLASLPAATAQLEYSSRSIVFARDGRRLLRAWGPPRHPFVVGVEPAAHRWTVQAWGAPPAVARAAVREMFSLADPLEEFYRLVRSDPVLRGTDRTFRGLRLPRDANVFESLFHAVVGQQLSVASANAIKRRLLERFGRPLVVEGIEVPVVPSPRAVDVAGPEGLRAAGLSRAKARSLREIAREATRLPPADRLRSLPRSAALASLVRWQGVGPWTAENALLRGAGRRDVFVAGDLGIRVALERFGAVPRQAPEARARAWADLRYPGWGSYATLYLWRRLVAEAPGRFA